jgi:hypothetical protein
MLDQIKQNTETGAKYLPEYEVHIRDESGELIAKVKKEIYIRKKQKK